MALNIREMTDTSFINLKPGTYKSRVTGVAELGLQETTYKDVQKIQKQIALLFSVFENDGSTPVILGKSFAMTIRDNATLRKAIIAIRGKDFTPEELNDWDLAELLGLPCLITIDQYERKGYTNMAIKQITTSLTDSTTPEIEVKDYIYFDIDDMETWTSFTRMPKWLQIKINNSITMKNMGCYICEKGVIYDHPDTTNVEQYANETADAF